jgi:hypothetical protein
MATPVSPAHPEYDHKGMIHRDTDMTRYPEIPFHVQRIFGRSETHRRAAPSAGSTERPGAQAAGPGPLAVIYVDSC